MREILFKGKRNDNGKWVEGSYCPKKTGHYEDDKFDKFVEEIQHLIIVNMNDGGYQYAEVEPETVGQYTDSTAIGGKKIFEHDIIEKDDAIGIVKFGKYGNGFHLGYYIDWINCPHFRNELHFWEGRVRVIGNIFENPELVARRLTEM